MSKESKEQNKADKARWRALGWQLVGLSMTGAPKAERYRATATALRDEADALDARAEQIEASDD
jgi:hypothetical protein